MSFQNIIAFSNVKKLPETVVVVVTTHGYIPLDSSNQPEIFQIPAGITLTKISSASPGVCEFIGPELTDMITEKLFARNLFYINSIEIIEQIATDLASELKQIKQEYLRMEGKKLKTAYGYDPEYSAFNHQYGNIYNVSSGLQTAINKKYMVKPDDIIEPQSSFDRINILLPPVYIVDYLESSGTDYQYISLEELMTDLKKYGVKNVLLVDLSCSLFVDSEGEYLTNERVTRNVRRDIKKDKLGGKKQKNKKNKTRKRERKRKLKTRKLNTRNKK